MAESQNIEIIDRLYESALIGEYWPATLSRLTTSLNSSSAALFAISNAQQRWTGSKEFIPVLEDYFSGGWHAKNDHPERFLSRRLSGFVTELDIYDSEAEFQHSPMVEGFLKPRGIGRELSTVIQSPSGDFIVLATLRDINGPTASPNEILRANMLRPHLARAAMVSARLGLERAKAQTEALEQLGLPAFVLSEVGRLIVPNRLGIELIPKVFQDRSRRFSLTDKHADTLLQDSLSSMRYANDGPQSLPLRSLNGSPAVLHLLPIRRSVHDIFNSASAILVVTPLEKDSAPSEAILQSLFDLTPAEARVARAIVSSQSISEFADSYGVSRETVRTQLKQVMLKTGVNRQAKLVSLLSGAKNY